MNRASIQSRSSASTEAKRQSERTPSQTGLDAQADASAPSLIAGRSLAQISIEAGAETKGYNSSTDMDERVLPEQTPEPEEAEVMGNSGPFSTISAAFETCADEDRKDQSSRVISPVTLAPKWYYQDQATPANVTAHHADVGHPQ